MSTTLKERVTERMQATGLKNAALARACGVQQPTSFNWASGKTKNIKGEPLLKAAAALGVTPEWLATGKGPKFPVAQDTNSKSEESSAMSPPGATDPTDQWTLEALKIMSRLDETDKRAVVANMRTFIQNLSRPEESQTSPPKSQSSAGGESHPIPRQRAA